MKNNYNREVFLRQALRTSGLTMGELEKHLGMSEEEIITGLSGSDQVKHINRVSKALGVDPAFFWGGEG